MKSDPHQLLWIQEGATISNGGKDYVITALADINTVLAKEVGSKTKVLLKIGDIGPPRIVGETRQKAPAERDLSLVDELDWEVAQERRRIIDPLLNGSRRDAAVEEVASEAVVSRATIYRWVYAFRNSGLLSSLLPNTAARGGKGKARISPEVEAIIKDTIETFHDTEQKTSKAATIVEIRRRCSNANLALPAANTIRARLERTDGRERTAKRMGEAAAHDQFDPIKGSIPDSNWPLAMVQIDHTLLPVVIVDDVYRKSIRRAWITLAIDVYSRVCIGMHLSLDAPSAMSAGMCISNAILPKEKWLTRLGITQDWPCWGTMGVLHMDNAREFRGDMLRTACKEYDIDLHLRPVKKPRYGAHIERLMGTVSERLKPVKGATFSGPDEKGEYDAEGNACMTFGELERWLILLFARYHRERHDGLDGLTPLEKWRDGLLGTKETPGRGLPARRLDEEVLRLNFMPFFERTIQNYGVVLDDVHYYHDVLRPWIGAKHPEFEKHSRKFRFHRDPRDISVLYFYDEIAQRYFSIPYRDVSLPPVSIWELRDAHRRAEERGVSRENEKAIFAIINEQRKIEDEAAEKTKSARRAQQKRTQHAEVRRNRTDELPSVGNQPHSSPPPAVRGYDPEAVVPLEDD